MLGSLISFTYLCTIFDKLLTANSFTNSPPQTLVNAAKTQHTEYDRTHNKTSPNLLAGSGNEKRKSTDQGTSERKTKAPWLEAVALQERITAAIPDGDTISVAPRHFAPPRVSKTITSSVNLPITNAINTTNYSRRSLAEPASRYQPHTPQHSGRPQIPAPQASTAPPAKRKAYVDKVLRCQDTAAKEERKFDFVLAPKERHLKER
jgi:hypothetical protein